MRGLNRPAGPCFQGTAYATPKHGDAPAALKCRLGLFGVFSQTALGFTIFVLPIWFLRFSIPFSFFELQGCARLSFPF